MSANPITHIARLPHGFRVRFTWSAGGLQVEWEPDVPRIKSRRQWRKFFEAYIAARHEFLRTVATSLGINIGIVDVPDEVTGGKLTFETVNPATKH